MIELTDKLAIELVDHMGTELNIVNAARVSFDQKSEELTEKDLGLIKFLMRERHASPFESCVATFRVNAPIFVVREWMRHRTQSFSEKSGRYTTLSPQFYTPNSDRPLQQVGKAGAYTFEEGTELQKEVVRREIRLSAQTSWDSYEAMLNEGIAKEVARSVLPVNIYTTWMATANLRNWLGFLSLRAEDQALYEIRQLAFQIEDSLAELYPVTLEAWNKFGRQAV